MRVAARPRDGLVERGGEDRLAHVALEVLALELAAQQLLRRQLTPAELGRVPGALAADYLHSSAPLRQTYTNATRSSAMKTTVSIRANEPNARSWTATG